MRMSRKLTTRLAQDRRSFKRSASFQQIEKQVWAFLALTLLTFSLGVLASAQTAETQFFQGFEADNSGWFDFTQPAPVRVPSGTNGIAAKTGGFYGQVGPGDPNTFTRWGGYSSVFPSRGYTTSLDIYLDVSGGYANDTRFDFSSAISNPGGTHRRDFIFSVGFYDDAGPFGSGDRFVVSASNNSPGNPRDVGRSPFVITGSGWYTFRHRFYDSGGGVLAVDLEILDAGGTVLNTWTLSDPTDIIGSTVGGNRYGWIVYSDFSSLAIDNSERANFVEIRNVDDDGMASATDCDASDAAFTTIQSAISDVSTLPGDLVNVCPGTYLEDINVNKAGLRVIGAGAASTTISGAIGGDGATVRIGANNVTVASFTITRQGNNTTDWNNPGLNFAGVAVQGTSITNMLIRDNTITGNRTGIDVNDSNGHTIRNNIIDNNRTGLLFRNQTNNIICVENFIANNWTMGVLFLDASSGTNTPLQQALGSKFSNNNISGNWYGQVVDRQTGGSLPTPGTTNFKDFRYNWLGTTSPVISTSNSAEPGYSTQIPVIFGGTATAPGGQPDLLGPASANIFYTPLLTSDTDTNVETVAGRGTYGFQGGTANITVSSSMLNGWFFYNDENDTIDNALGSFVPGPGTSPLGVGSSQISVTGTERVNLATYQLGGTTLASITELKYSTYNPSAGNGGGSTRAGYLQFNVDFDLSDTWQNRLYFVPRDNGTVLPDTWQEWDTINGGNALWGYSRNTTWPAGIGGGGEPSGQAPGAILKTWDQILSQYPNVRIRVSDPWLGIRVGEPYADGYTENIDAFKISTTTGSVTFDFEPERPSVTIDQAAGQLDPTSSSPVNFTVVFSEPVTGFTDADVSLGGTAGATTAVVTGGGTTYNVAVSGMTGSGSVIANIVDSAATADSNGAPSEASTSTDNSVTFFTCNTVTTEDVDTLTGVPVTVPVLTDDVTGRGLIAVDFTFTFDSAVMTPAATPATAGAVWASSTPVVTYHSPSSGVLNVSVYGTGLTPDAIGAGSVIDLHFDVIGPIGSTSGLAVSNVLFNGGLQCVDPPVNGTLTVISGTITGNVTYANAATPVVNVRGVDLNAPGTPAVSDTTDANGDYSLSGFGPGSYTVTPSKARYAFGTSGPTTSIFSNDAALIAQHVVGLITLNSTQLLAAKVSGNATATVSSFDAALISQWIVNINPTNPVNHTGEWVFTPASVNHGVVTANVTQDYTAILLGDVNGSWSNLAGSLMESLMSPPVLAEPTDDSVNVSVPVMKAEAGSTVSVPFRIDNLKGRQITSYQFDVGFDPSVLRAGEIGASVAGTNSEGLTVVSNEAEPGLLKVVAYGALPVSGDGVYLNLNFSVQGSEGATTTLKISGFRFNDGTDIIFAESGELFVTAAETNVIRGRLVTTGGKPVGDTSVTLLKGAKYVGTATSDAGGWFVFSRLDTGETYTIVAESKRYRFRPVTLGMTDNVVAVEIIANQ